ncbi:MAG: TonB family protein [Saprospiraceae bacterium]
MEYILEVTLCWLFFYGFYYAFLRKETFFRVNRIYLISSLILGLIIPKITFSSPQPEVVFVQTVQLSVQAISAQVEATAMTLPTWKEVFWIIYLLGIIILTIRLVADIFKIIKIYQSSIVVQKTNYKLVLSNNEHPPFSLFNYLFINKKTLEEQTESDKIITHELAHIKGKHSFDVFLSEALCIIFWFNPLVYWYKKSLQDVHEYLADYEVTRNTSIKTYGHLLMRQAMPSAYLSLSNHFNHSQLKKRIQMMTKKQSSKWAYTKYVLALPIVIMMAILFSAYDYPTVLQEKADDFFQKENTVTSTIINNSPVLSETATSTLSDNNDPIYREVDEMPRYPGCEEIADKEEKKQCSNIKLLTFIYTNVKYPKEAQKNGTEGVTVIEFVVKSNGNIGDFKIIKPLADGCDKAALTALEKMADTKWIPGIKDGKKVNVKMVIPVKFKLADDDEATEETPSKVTKMPLDPTCNEENDQLNTLCTINKINTYIGQHLKYPETAKKDKIEGTVHIVFIVKTDGTFDDIKVSISLREDCDKAALAVMEKIQNNIKWNPGEKDGKPVNTQMTLPIKFVLD